MKDCLGLFFLALPKILWCSVVVVLLGLKGTAIVFLFVIATAGSFVCRIIGYTILNS